MMLLQAGQLGLSRRDSIWTDEIPPEMVAGVTLWVDFTDPESLYKGGSYGGGNPVHGDLVLSARNKVNPTNGLGGSGVAAKLKDPATPSTQSALSVNSSLGVSEFFPENNSMAALVTATTKLIIAAVKVGAANPYVGYGGDAIVVEGMSYTGLILSDDSGVLAAHAYNYSSSGEQYATRTFPRDTWVVITMSHQSSQLRCRVNGGVWATTASGTTGSLISGATFLSFPNGGATRMECAHLVTVNTTQTDASIAAIEHWMALDVGITPWW